MILASTEVNDLQLLERRGRFDNLAHTLPVRVANCHHIEGEAHLDAVENLRLLHSLRLASIKNYRAP